MTPTPTLTDGTDGTTDNSTSTDNSTIIEPPVAGGNKTVNPLVCTALQKWYQSLNGNGWIVKTGWDSSNMSTCCSWFNVHCSGIGQVIKV
jgi:hypothetical protein